MNITVQTPNLRDIERRLGDLKPEASKAMARAINRASQSATTQMKKLATKDYIIKQQDIAKAIKKPQKADKNNLKTEVLVMGRKIFLSKFKINPKKPWNISSGSNSRKKRRLKRPENYKAQVKKASSLKRLLKSFVINTRNGPQMVSRRPNLQGQKKFIFSFGPSIPDMLANRRNYQIIKQETISVLQRRIDHEINRILENVQNR